jgi:thioesterase domain-containing protein/acyl carrier protein
MTAARGGSDHPVTEGKAISAAAGEASDVTIDAIATLFAEILKVAAVRRQDNFFRLGGDSLLAESLILAVQERFGVEISISTLYERPTPQALAWIVGRGIRPPDRCLIAVRPEGLGPPLFCLHGMSGNVTYGDSLKTVFGSERPLYAIRARGLLPSETPATSVEECAADYIRLIRKARPHGPYLLLAPCGPSIIAYEMAQQLVRAGETVAGVILADPSLPAYEAWTQRNGLARMLLKSQSATRATRLRAAVTVARANSPFQRNRLVEKALGAAISVYIPSPYPGKVLLLYSAEWSRSLMDPQHGFPTLVRNLKAVEVSESHIDFTEDFRGRPAAEVRAFLEEAAPLAGSAPA